MSATKQWVGARRFAAVLVFAGLASFTLGACSNELKVSEIEPPQGTSNGGEEVIIHGNGFQPGRAGVSVRFGRRDGANVVVESATKIKVTTPAGDKSTAVDVAVTFDDGKAFVLKGGFTYLDASQQRATMDNAFNAMGSKKKE